MNTISDAEKAKRYRQWLVGLLEAGESLFAALDSNNIGRVSNSMDELHSEVKTIRLQLEVGKLLEEKNHSA